MARIFVYEGRKFDDPGTHLTVKQVQEQLAAFFGELNNATVEETKSGNDTVYTFKKRVGVKGT